MIGCFFIFLIFFNKNNLLNTRKIIIFAAQNKLNEIRKAIGVLIVKSINDAKTRWCQIVYHCHNLNIK